MLIYAGFATILIVAIVIHLRSHNRREAEARLAAKREKVTTRGPAGRHPHIDTDWCIGCGACVSACPEGDVLAVIGGKAALINGHKCIGHELCAEACPVGAIQIVMAPPSMTGDLPALTSDYETSVANLFVVGELGGLALIKNAVNQGRDCIDRIAARNRSMRPVVNGAPPMLDVVIVGAGPAGLSASLRAVERKLEFLTIEAEDLGGTVAKYPRQKLVMTSPVEFPLHGKFKKLEISKENLLEFWHRAATAAGRRIRTRERVEVIRRESDGSFAVVTAAETYRARAVILAIGRRGTPRKLGIVGEELPHVMYSLLDAEAYTGKKVLIVGGGDSAVEAAMGLAHQKGNRVTLSYRRETFTRLKDRNEQRVADLIKRGKIEAVFNSEPISIREGAVRLRTPAGEQDVAAEFVWIFAGGVPPRDLLERVGVQFGRVDLSPALVGASRAGL